MSFFLEKGITKLQTGHGFIDMFFDKRNSSLARCVKARNFKVAGNFKDRKVTYEPLRDSYKGVGMNPSIVMRLES
jgi:hypothetical protein